MIRFPKLLGLLLAVNIISLGGCSDAGFVTPPQQLLGNTLNTPSSEDNPRFNYDGRYLVFASDRMGQRTIYLFDRVANRLVPLPGLNQAKTYQDQPDISAVVGVIEPLADMFIRLIPPIMSVIDLLM